MSMTYDELKSKVADLRDATDALGLDSKRAFESLQNSLLQSGLPAKEVTNIMSQFSNSLKLVGQLSADEIIKLKNLGFVIDETGQLIRQAKAESIGFSQSLTALSSAAMTLGFAINSIKNLGNIWNDETKSDGEKMLSIFTQMAMLAPQIAMLHKTLKPLFSAEGGFLATAGPVLGVVAGIAAVAIVVKQIYEEYNKYSIAAEKAAKVTKDLNEATDEAKQQFESLKSAFDSYQSLVDKLNSCTKGTQEWRDALQEVYNEVLNLKRDYPDLIETGIGDDGQLYIKNMDAILEASKDRINTIQAAALYSQNLTSEANLAASRENIAHKHFKSYETILMTDTLK